MGDYEQFWHSFFKTIDLFEQVAIEVANILEYQYPTEDANKVKQYLTKNERLTTLHDSNEAENEEARLQSNF